MRGKIDKIEYIEEKEKDGKKFYRFRIICNQDEIVGIGDRRDFFRVGDTISYYFDDRWNTGKVNQPKRIL